jgi:hypothetical protein
MEELIKKFHLAYLKNKGCMLGTPDYNHTIVAEFLRNQILPGSLVKEEFDNIKLPRVDKVILSNFEKDLKSLKNYSEEEKISLNKKIDYELGMFENKRFRTGFSEKVNGFAMEAKTFRRYITSDFGDHWNADMYLYYQITKKNLFLERYKVHICKGLIINKILENGSPLLILYPRASNIDDLELKKIVQFLKTEKKYIIYSHGYKGSNIL